MIRKDTVAVHSLKLATYLMVKGCVLKGVENDLRKSNKYKIYLFKDSDYLQNNIAKYSQDETVKKELLNLKERM